MSDPRRLAEGSGELPAAQLAEWLISSARDEAPGPASLQRTLVGLGIGSAVIATASSGSANALGANALGASAVGASAVGTSAVGAGAGAAASGGSAAGASSAAAGGIATGASASGAALGTGLATKTSVLSVALVKWAGVTVIGGAALVGTASKVLTPKTVAPAQPAAEQASAPVRPAAPQPSQSETPTPNVGDPTATAARSRSQLTPPSPSPPEAQEAWSQPAEATVDAAELAKEVSLLDQAREAYAAGHPARALGHVQQYLTRFPRGRLVPEAMFLKMESAHALGQTQQAVAAANWLLKVAPNSPQASRAQELVSKAP